MSNSQNLGKRLSDISLREALREDAEAAKKFASDIAKHTTVPVTTRVLVAKAIERAKKIANAVKTQKP